MLNKLIIVFISLALTSCFFEKTKKPVVIIDRSTGQENIDFDRFSIIPQPEGQTVDRKIDKKTNSALIPVAGRINPDGQCIFLAKYHRRYRVF
jgi:hypothetical protein